MTEATKQELLGCPFCGSSDIDPEGVASFKLEHQTPENTWDKCASNMIENRPACTNCGATTSGDWNTRAPLLTKTTEPVSKENISNENECKAAAWNWFRYRLGIVDVDIKECREEIRRIHKVLQAPQPEEVTEDDISQCIQTWCFDDDIDEAFGSYLMKKYPHGLKVVKEKTNEI